MLRGAALDAPAGQKRAPSKSYRWTRVPKEDVSVDLLLDAAALAKGHEVVPGIFLEGYLGEAKAPGLAPATRALSLFVVNRRPIAEDRPFDESCIFQVGLEVRHAGGLIARPNRQDEASPEDDEKVVDLQFRDRCEWAVGHGVSVEPVEESGAVAGARTTWVPRHEVRRVETLEIAEVTTSMDALGDLVEGEGLRRRLAPLVEHYGVWIARQRRMPVGTARREETRDMLMHRAEEARRRIARGIDLLVDQDDVREAFRLANRAMAAAARQRSPGRYVKEVPSWRLFQLAFLLLNLEGVADPLSEDRTHVELLFFPTGGSKTEAYLGVTAFALALRRLRGQGRADAGLGVAVLLRYTLRLLTLDQLGRAATLVCALERLRQKQPERPGQERFATGLWVGRSTTPNTLDQAIDEISAYRSAHGPSPFPLPSCPWCRTPLGPQSMTTEPPKKPERVIVGCLNVECPFATANNAEGIPVLFVDDQIYRELPCFLVATVDKLAMLPWRGPTGALFGRVHSRAAQRRAMARASSPTQAPPSNSIMEALGGPRAMSDIAFETASVVSSWLPSPRRRTLACSTDVWNSSSRLTPQMTAAKCAAFATSQWNPFGHRLASSVSHRKAQRRRYDRPITHGQDVESGARFREPRLTSLTRRLQSGRPTGRNEEACPPSARAGRRSRRA